MNHKLVWLGLFVVIALAACSSSESSAPGTAPTPTLSNVFLDKTPAKSPDAKPTGNETRGAPTLSVLFESTPMSATVSAPNATGTPTVALVFRNDATMVPVVTRDPAHTPTIAPVMRPISVTEATPVPTRTPRSTSAATTRPTPRSDLTEFVVFDETVNANWSLDNSVGAKIDPKNTTRAQSGRTAIAMTPEKDFATLYFTVGKQVTAANAYLRSRVWGVSLWVNADGEIGPEDLALTLVGSNASPSWVADDKSVTIDDKHFFSETRLYYLGISRIVPANTWVELSVQTDKLPYDPEYKYLTGIYLKNGQGFLKTIYVDRVTLWLNK